MPTDGGGQPDPPPARPPSDEPRSPPPPPARDGRLPALVLSFLAFVAIGFGVWVVSARKRYREQYAQATEGWISGRTRMVELTLVRDDRHNLGCASDLEVAGLRCGHRQDASPVGSASPADRQTLQPYNTLENELFLGAALWASPELNRPLPEKRFSVVCNFNMKGVMRSVAIRFSSAAPFTAVTKSVAVGTLSDCTLSR